MSMDIIVMAIINTYALHNVGESMHVKENVIADSQLRMTLIVKVESLTCILTSH